MNKFNKTYNILMQSLISRGKKWIAKYDKMEEFTNKRVYDNGRIVVYDVRDDWYGLWAIRQILDDQYGEDFNPWRWITRDIDPVDQYDEEGQGYGWDPEDHYFDDASEEWAYYRGCPKKVAFCDGELIGMCASTNRHPIWWDLKGLSNDVLMDPDGDPIIETGNSILLQMVTLNQQTGLYDCDGNLSIDNADLINGYIPIKLGVVEGDFELNHCKDLKGLRNCPRIVKGNCDISYNNLESLEGAPQKVGKKFNCQYNKLKTLEGGPIFVRQIYNCSNNQLVSLKGAPEQIGNPDNNFGELGSEYCEFDCQENYLLKTLEGAPKRVYGNFSAWCCKRLTNLDGAPIYVKGDFNIARTAIVNLMGSPEETGDYIATSCPNLTSFEGITPKINGNLDVSWSFELVEKVNAIQYVKGKFTFSVDKPTRQLDTGTKTISINGTLKDWMVKEYFDFNN